MKDVVVHDEYIYKQTKTNGENKLRVVNVRNLQTKQLEKRDAKILQIYPKP